MMEIRNRVRVTGGMKARGKVSIREKGLDMSFISYLIILKWTKTGILYFDSVLSKFLLCQNVPRIKLALPNCPALRHS